MPEGAGRRPTVFFQELHEKHKNYAKKDELESPQRVRAVEYGTAAILARLEGANPNYPSPLKIVRSMAELHNIADNVAARIMFGMKEEDEPARENYAERLWQWCKDCALPSGKFEPDLYGEQHGLRL